MGFLTRLIDVKQRPLIRDQLTKPSTHDFRVNLTVLGGSKWVKNYYTRCVYSTEGRD